MRSCHTDMDCHSIAELLLHCYAYCFIIHGIDTNVISRWWILVLIKHL